MVYTSCLTSCRTTATAFSPMGGAQCPHKKKKLDLRKLGNIRKLSKPDRMIAQRPFSPPKRKICQYYQKTLEKQNLNLPRCALFHMKTRVSVKYFVSHCLCKLLF